MKKFVILYVGSVEPSQNVMDGWTKWFEVLGDRVVDSGNPFAAGVEIMKDGSKKDLPAGVDAISGYTIINAQSQEEVEEMVKNDCPTLTSVKIFEALPM